MFDEKIHFLKVNWQFQDDYDYRKSTPYLLFQNFSELGSNNLKKFFLSPGEKINLKVTEDKYCIGHEPSKGQWVSCPNTAKLENGLFCKSCERDDFYSCRKMCQGFYCKPKTIEAKALCDINETVLYLTYVGGSFKVGVSLNPMRRWVEQGSYYSTILSKGNGLVIRFYETTINQQLGVRLAVSNKTKIKFIGEKSANIENIKKKFNDIVNDIKKLDIFEPVSPLEIVDLRAHYHDISHLKRKVIIDNKYLFGVVIGVLGKILIVKDKETYYATELSKIQGKILVETNHIKRQRSLFDY